MAQINFETQKPLNSQQTIVLVLKRYKYYFKSVSEYDNSQFYCLIRHDSENYFNNWLVEHLPFLHIKRKEDYFDCPLALCFCNCLNTASDEPFIFTQEDIKKIIMDVPENYIGEARL